WPGVSLHSSSAELRFDGRGDWRVHRHQISSHRSDGPIPSQVASAWFPGEPPISLAAAELGHAEPINPGLRAGADDQDRIAWLQAVGILEVKTRRANRDVIIFDFPGPAEGIRPVVL